jgi:Ca-activated chloride channel family protein
MWDLAAPLALALLPLPLLAWRFLPPAGDPSGALRVPSSIKARFQIAQPGPIANSGRAVLCWLVWLGIICALADPRVTLAAPALPASGREIILVLDLSGSMEQRDFTVDGEPVRRIDAMRRVAKEFIRRRAGDRIGLVVFAEVAYVAAAPTFDIAAVNQALDDVSIGLVGRSTAIGTGLGLALKRLRESNASTRLVILLSDGADNASSADPLAVARLAGTLGIRVHTIAFGLHDLANPEGDPDPVDTETLRKVAEASGGTAFRVHSTEELEEVSQSIERLESSSATAPPTVIRKDLWFYPGALAFLASFALLVLDRRRT